MRFLTMAAAIALATPLAAAPLNPTEITALKAEAVTKVAANAKLAQVMNDTIFSFGELGYQEVETSKYITAMLEKHGFTIKRGVAGMPTGWTATWTNGSTPRTT